MAPFSALLVKLSRDADATAVSVNNKTKQLIVLTRWLIGLTITLVFLTIPIVWAETQKLMNGEQSEPANVTQSIRQQQDDSTVISNKERSSASDNLWNTNPDLSTNDILNNIKQWAVQSTAGGPSLSYMIAPFSALLVKLSRDADATARSVNNKTQQLIVLTRWLIGLTIVLVLLTFPLVWAEMRKLIKADQNGASGKTSPSKSTASHPHAP